MSLIINWEEFFTKNEIWKRLEKFVEKTSVELKRELRENRKNNIISNNSKINYV